MDELSVNDFGEILEIEAEKLMSDREINDRKEINNGHCGQFKRMVFDHIRMNYDDEYLIWSKGSDKPTVQSHTYGGQELVNASHVWLEYKNLHFDAECTSGVENIEDLPLFRRNNISLDDIK